MVDNSLSQVTYSCMRCMLYTLYSRIDHNDVTRFALDLYLLYIDNAKLLKGYLSPHFNFLGYPKFWYEDELINNEAPDEDEGTDEPAEEATEEEATEEAKEKEEATEEAEEEATEEAEEKEEATKEAEEEATEVAVAEQTTG